MLSTSTSTYVPSGLSTSTSTEIRYSSTTSTSTKYSGPNPAGNPLMRIFKGLKTIWKGPSIETNHKYSNFRGPVYHDITYGTAITVQTVNQILDSQQSPHMSPSRVSNGVSVVRIWEKNDCVIKELHCIDPALQYQMASLGLKYHMASLGLNELTSILP